MIAIIPKWRVTVQAGDKTIEFFVSDLFASNVLRKIAGLDFGEATRNVTITRSEDRQSTSNATIEYTTTPTPGCGACLYPGFTGQHIPTCPRSWRLDVST